MIIHEILDFSACTDLVSTEEAIWKNLELENPNFEDKYIFIKFPFADIINKNNRNIGPVNLFIQSLRAKYPDNKTLIFICQHIDASRIILPYNSLLFTPHATIRDPYIALPHFTPFEPISPVAIEDRNHLFCFHGASSTHHTRHSLLTHYNSDDDFSLLDTGRWHFEKDSVSRDSRQKTYAKTLSHTIFSLCPRGTGPSTIRIWDSLALGSIPVIISDGLKMPLPTIVEWNKCCVFIPEKELGQLKDMVPQKDVALDMIFYGHEIYNKFFNIKNIHETIKISLMNYNNEN